MMPRILTLSETGYGPVSEWTTKPLGGEHSVTYKGVKGVNWSRQQLDVTDVKVGRVYRVRFACDYKVTLNDIWTTGWLKFGTADLTTFVLTVSGKPTSYTAAVGESGNIYSTQNLTQAQINGLLFEESINVTTDITESMWTRSRQYIVKYCYEHNPSGLVAMKMNKFGGVSNTKIKKIAGRSQISGYEEIFEY